MKSCAYAMRHSPFVSLAHACMSPQHMAVGLHIRMNGSLRAWAELAIVYKTSSRRRHSRQPCLLHDHSCGGTAICCARETCLTNHLLPFEISLSIARWQVAAASSGSPPKQHVSRKPLCRAAERNPDVVRLPCLSWVPGQGCRRLRASRQGLLSLSDAR